mgnify:CR=1 FL=1
MRQSHFAQKAAICPTSAARNGLIDCRNEAVWLGARVNDTDAQLVRSVLSGDQDAFGRLIAKYERQAAAVVYRLLGNAADTQDALQDGFLRAYRALGDLEKPQRFKSWLMRIMVNRALNIREQRSRQSMVRFSELAGGRSEDDEDVADTVAVSDGPGAVENLQAGELNEALQAAINDLPEVLRTSLLLFTVEKLPQKEIADMMGISPAAVKWNVFEARRRLRQKLDKLL